MFRPLRLEGLEDRVLLSLTVFLDGNNNCHILGVDSDQLWLKTSADQIQWSSDGSNYQNLGITTDSDATIQLGDMQKAHLVGFTGQGHSITFEGYGVSGGGGGEAGLPIDFSIEGDVKTLGGNFTVQDIQGIDVSPNVLISTRNVSSSADPISGASQGDSGNINLTSTNPDILNPLLNVNFDQPHVTVNAGAEILAQSDSSAYSSGTITLDAQNTNYALGTTISSSFAFLVRDASVNLTGATIIGGGVSIESDAGDQSLLNEFSSTGVAGEGTQPLCQSLVLFWVRNTRFR